MPVVFTISKESFLSFTGQRSTVPFNQVHLSSTSTKQEQLTFYARPLVIAVTTVAVIFTRYTAVVPLSELINLFKRHARGQRRREEIPHAYQMILFWSGLRGAVGIATAQTS